MDGNSSTAAERANALFSDFPDASGVATNHSTRDDPPVAHFTSGGPEAGAPTADRPE